MTTVSKTTLTNQWKTLHNSHESYEQYALIIKLVTIAITLFLLTFSLGTLVALLVIAILWLQEGIWKTFQSRTEAAIMAIEEQLDATQTEESEQPYLFYKEWQASRPRSKALVGEYLKNSLRPTVVYPYAPLMFLVCLF